MKALGILLLIAGACSYLFRAFNEMFHIQPNFSSEEGQFIGAILGLSGLIFLQFLKGERSNARLEQTRTSSLPVDKHPFGLEQGGRRLSSRYTSSS